MNFWEQTISTAGPNGEICGPVYTLEANNPIIGIGTWSIISQPAGSTVSFGNADDEINDHDAKANVVMCDPKWDVELEPDFFEPKIPAGYIRHEERGLIGINLENWPMLKVVSGMPAEKAGVKDGDVAVEVNGNSISDIKSSSDALNLLFGKAGEKVALTVKRGQQILTIEIERAPLPK